MQKHGGYNYFTSWFYCLCNISFLVWRSDFLRSVSKFKDLTFYIFCNGNTQLRWEKEQHKYCTSGSFLEIRYVLYNAPIFWPCEITDAWHCSLRSVGTEKSARSGLTECFLSMQVCCSKHIKEMFETDICVTTDTQLTKKPASDLLCTLNWSIKASMLWLHFFKQTFSDIFMFLCLSKLERRKLYKKTIIRLVFLLQINYSGDFALTALLSMEWIETCDRALYLKWFWTIYYSIKQHHKQPYGATLLTKVHRNIFWENVPVKKKVIMPFLVHAADGDTRVCFCGIFYVQLMEL